MFCSGSVALVVALVVVTWSTVSRASESTPRDASLAEIDLSTDPGEAHVYLRRVAAGSASAEPEALCTGGCTMLLTPGAYRVEAGLMHGQLTRASPLVLLHDGEVLDLHVGVRPNVARNTIVPIALGATLACLVAYIAVGAAHWPDFPEGRPKGTPLLTGSRWGPAPESR